MPPIRPPPLRSPSGSSVPAQSGCLAQRRQASRPPDHEYDQAQLATNLSGSDPRPVSHPGRASPTSSRHNFIVSFVSGVATTPNLGGMVGHAVGVTGSGPNSELRAARLRRRWTEDDVAVRLYELAEELGEAAPGVDANQVSKWERHARNPGRYYRPRLCLIFECTPTELGFEATPRLLRDLEELRRARPHTRPTAGPLVGSTGPAATPPHPATGLVPAAAISRAVLRGGDFSNPSLDGPADHGFVELIHQTINQLVVLDNHFGADDIAGIAVRLFRSATDRLATGSYQSAIERDLMAAAGEIGELAGWLLFDADRQETARQVNQDALYWAGLGGDSGMVNFILSNVGLQAIHLGRPLEALRVAQRVRNGDGRLSPRIRALIHVREGRAFALAGRHGDALRDFQRARAFFSDGPRGSDPQWTWWIDDFEITGHEGLCHREAGDARGAVGLFQRAIESCPPGRARDRFMYHAHLLRTMVDLKDWPGVASVMDQTAPFVSEMCSARVASFVLDATATIREAQGVPQSVRDGADHLDALLARTGQ